MTPAPTSERLQEELRNQVQQEVREQVATALAGFRRGTTIVAFSGDMDRLFAALSLASASAACGLETTIFFTFWAVAALRKTGGADQRKPWLPRLLAWMIPNGADKLPVSRMNFAGLGAAFFRWRMRTTNIQALPELLEDARAVGVRFVVCQMSLDVLGLREEELLDGMEFGGAAAFLQDASESTVTLFV